MAGKLGSGGPIPKRSAERVGGHAPAIAVLHAAAGEPVEWPEPAAHWGELARFAWEAAQRSGQSRFYEQTDIALLRFGCEAMDRCLQGAGTRRIASSMSPQMVSAVAGIFSDLLFTEADRRRLRIELERESGPSDAALDFRRRWGVAS